MTIFLGNGLLPFAEELGLLALVFLIAPPARGAEQKPLVAVIIGTPAPPLEHYAAEQLCHYLGRLFGLHVQPTQVGDGHQVIPASAQVLFLLGSPTTNPAVPWATGNQPFPSLTDQGFVLRRMQFQKRPTLLVGGGSPVATLWAVYALAERWGVRYLLHGDVLPQRSTFHFSLDRWSKERRGLLPPGDVVKEPLLRVRQWRVINDFALGPESWGLQDYRPVIDQLAKLRFNRLFAHIYPYRNYSGWCGLELNARRSEGSAKHSQAQSVQHALTILASR